MANGWTLERKQRQAELIKTWRPWDKSTGPKTEAGKAASSRNADKGRATERESLRSLDYLIAQVAINLPRTIHRC